MYSSFVLPLECGLDFDPAREEEFFAALPPRAAVFLVEPRAELTDAQPYLLRTADLRRRLERLLRQPEVSSKRLNLREFAGRVRYRLTGSKFEQSLVFYQHARQLYPRRYRDLMRLHPAALLKVNLANAYPRCYVTRRIGGRGFYFGPFPSRRAAEAFANEFLNLYKIRRCQIKIRRDPSFPGCIYSEMKMCLAPCFAGCSKEEYDAEVSRVVSFLGTSGASLSGEFEREREAASEALDFERAAALHRRLEKVAEVLRGLPELARSLDELDAIILQRAAEENTIAVFAVRGGFIADPLFLRFAELASRPRSVEEILREHLDAWKMDVAAPFRAPRGATAAQAGDGGLQPAAAPATARNGEELGEHLALLARWFYSKPRHGEIFFAESRAAQRSGAPALARADEQVSAPAAAGEVEAPQQQLGFTFPAAMHGAGARHAASDASAPREWPYRRILRGCSRLLAPPQEEKGETRK